MNMYCVKCKKEVDVKDPTIEEHKYKKRKGSYRMAKAVCPTCKTGMRKFLPKQEKK